ANALHLPLGAHITIVESERTVNTDPDDGTYSLIHQAGEFHIQAGSYGFETKEKAIDILKDETVEENFHLEEIPQATVTGEVIDETTNEPIEGAKVLLEEDANIKPVETDAEGNYSLTAYEGTYTLKVVAGGYHYGTIDITLENGDIEEMVELEPLYT